MLSMDLQDHGKKAITIQRVGYRTIGFSFAIQLWSKLLVISHIYAVIW